jgi:hypothetical protein
MQAAELSAVGAKVGAILTPENVALPILRFRTAFMLSYGGFPLRSSPILALGAPVLLCILVNRAPDALTRSEQGADLSLAWWSRSEGTHLLLGRPQERAPPWPGRSKNEFNLLFARTVRRVLAICEFVAPGIARLRPRSLLAEARRVGIAWLAALNVSVGRQSAAAGEA